MMWRSGASQTTFSDGPERIAIALPAARLSAYEALWVAHSPANRLPRSSVQHHCSVETPHGGVLSSREAAPGGKILDLGDLRGRTHHPHAADASPRLTSPEPRLCGVSVSLSAGLIVMVDASPMTRNIRCHAAFGCEASARRAGSGQSRLQGPGSRCSGAGGRRPAASTPGLVTTGKIGGRGCPPTTDFK